MNRFFIFLIFGFISHSFCAQKDTLSNKNELRFYLETYYGANLGLYNTNEKNMPDFHFSHHRHNEFNLNLGMIHYTHESHRVRAKLGLMTGTYANRNLEDEPGVLKNIYEANIGFQLMQNEYFWLDMGVFEAHTGFESAITKDQNFMTRSILAENSPYYSSGLDLNYTTANNYWKFSVLALNGWQNIRRENEIQVPAIGHQIKYTPNKYLTVNSSSFIGQEIVPTGFRNRIFHNFFAQLETNLSSIIFGFDYGMQRNFSNGWNEWIGATLEMKRKLFDSFYLAGRLEYFYDAGNTIIPIGFNGLYENYGITLSTHYEPLKNISIRLEGKVYQGAEDYYRNGENLSQQLWYLGFSMAFDLVESL
jgi:hypothetical protein